tara:strand:+ start:964 stop:1206 length:243 start_codon:yes stop_codon:yes gene_type:complete
MSRKQMIGFGLGLSAFLFLISIEPPSDMNPLGMKAVAVSMMMAIFWVTEAFSIFATSFLPIVLFLILGALIRRLCKPFYS